MTSTDYRDGRGWPLRLSDTTPPFPTTGDATEYADGYRLTRALIPTRAQAPSSIATQLIPSTSSRHRTTIRGKTQEDQLNGVNDGRSLV